MMHGFTLRPVASVGGALALALLTPSTALSVCDPATTQLCFTDASDRLDLTEFYVSTSNQSLGAVWIDVNGDLFPDLYAVNGFEAGAAAGGDPQKGLHHFFLNNGDGTFTERDDLLPALLSEIEMGGATAGDYDNDGDTDIYVYNQNEVLRPNSVLNPGDGELNFLLQNRAADNGCTLATPCTGADLPVPLFVDVAAGAGVDGDVGGAFGSQYAGRRTLSSRFADFDRDGCLDLFTAQWHIRHAGEVTNQNVLYRGDCQDSDPGDGVDTFTFTDVTADAGLPVHPGDASILDSVRATRGSFLGHLNEDLWPDMYWVNVSERSDPNDETQPPDVTDDNCALGCPERWFDQVFLNQGNSTFVDVHTQSPGMGDDSAAGMGVDVADIDLDGDWDIYLTDVRDTTRDSLPKGNVLYLYQGDDTWSDNVAVQAGVSARFSAGTSFFDADSDGDEDLLVATTNDGESSILYENDGDGTFTDVAIAANFEFLPNARGTATADIDRDGDLDFLVVPISDDLGDTPLALFVNDTEITDHWINLKLVGVGTDILANGYRTNLDAIGAIIEITVDGLGTLRRQIKGGSSAHSQSDFVANLGLGSNAPTTVDVRVRWPSGLVEGFEQLPIDNSFPHVLEELDGTGSSLIFATGFENGSTDEWN